VTPGFDIDWVAFVIEAIGFIYYAGRITKALEVVTNMVTYHETRLRTLEEHRFEIRLTRLEEES
jgi:hypothetical protein